METIELIKQSRAGDKLAREQVIKNNMALVYSIVKRFSGRGYDPEDLGQIGAIGLIKAVDNFDLSYDVKFSTYAVPLITGEIKRFMRDDGMVKVSRSLKENGWKVKRAAEELAGKLGREATMEELSAATELGKEEIVMALETLRPTESLNAIVNENDKNPIYLIDKLCVDADSGNKEFEKIVLKQLVSELKPKEQQLITMRYFKGATQMRVADMLGISQVQVSRMEKRILEDMRTKMAE